MNAELTIQKMKSVSSKNLRSVLAFFALAGLIFCSTACEYVEKKTNQRAIESVLEQDSKTETIYDDSSVKNYLYSVSNVVSNMRKIDLNDCPTEFQTAYIAHTGAWEKRLIVAQEIKAYDDRYNSFGGFFEAFLRGFFGDFDMPAEAAEELQRIKAWDSEATDAINSTWNEVLAVAVKYNVDVTKYK